MSDRPTVSKLFIFLLLLINLNQTVLAQSIPGLRKFKKYRVSRYFSEDLILAYISDALQLAKIRFR